MHKDLTELILSRQKEILTILRRLQFQFRYIREIIERHDKDISRIKEHLNIA
ncbi:MAG: hypothetical protein Q8P01_00570 [bacterium]|nr:hypothetical protein [bacterium]